MKYFYNENQERNLRKHYNIERSPKEYYCDMAMVLRIIYRLNVITIKIPIFT